MEKQELIPHLFRTEFSKITSVLTRYFGLENIELAEDIASETFLAAMESWTYNEVPANPTAWLYAVAKNKAINQLKRRKNWENKLSEITESLNLQNSAPEPDLSPANISDSQLQMLFAICHPAISAEAQIGLSLRILCGFGIEEIASALLSNKENISKRLFRAREKLRQEKIKMEMPSETEINVRLEVVLRTLYLLFNEGYYSEGSDHLLRKDLCLEAMRLVYQLTENEKTNLPEVNALLSLMCFHSSRFEARQNSGGEIILYEEQDETLWNQELVYRGAYFLHKAAAGNTLSKYHLEANIAYWYTIKTNSVEKWKSILNLYDQLLLIDYSPVAALNRIYALSKISGNKAAIEQAEKIELKNSHFYYILLAELYTALDKNKASENFQKAISLTKSEAERKLIKGKLDKLK